MSSSPTSSSSSDSETPPFPGLLDVPCRVTAVLGTTTITVSRCLVLDRHSIIRLQQAASDGLTVVVNGVTLARGEVVITGDRAALRISEIEPAPGEARVS